jgi:hypothetical protein
MVRRIKRKEIFALLLCLLIGFALRFYTFDKKSLWVDEVHTFNDSRDNLKAQINFYKNNPTYLHPPLFFILTHFFYPFTKPERDLRIIPLIFGALSIPMIYLLAKQFSANIAIPCTLSLTFMTYHISLSQDGRPYPLLMFVGMGGVYFFMKHLSTAKRLYLVWAACSFATLFYISYQAILSIIFYQILWFYQVDEKKEGCTLSSIVIFNGTLFLLCLPWLLFIVLSYKGQPMMDPLHTEAIGSFWHILYWMLNDWVGNFPLVIASAVLLILPLLLGFRKNRIILLTILILPVASLYLFCKLFNFTHFFASRYFINFLPLMFISIYLSLRAVEIRFERLGNTVNLGVLFAIFLIASNLMILPYYYRSEKQDLRGLVNYLKGHLLDGDNIFVRTKAYLPGILFYFGANPGGRHYPIIASKEPEKGMEYRIVSTDQGRVVRIFNSKSCCAQYLSEGNRLWIVVDKWSAKALKIDSPCVLKGFFDGSFANFRKFPSDASMYLFLWDPKSAEGRGINSAIE